MNAAQAALPPPRCQHKGCLLHLNHSHWRQVVDQGLRVSYNNEDNDPHTVRRDIQRLMALPFIPTDEVEAVFDAIVDEMDDRVLAFADHLENTYIRGHRALRRRRQVPPRFPIDKWNVYEQAVANEHRTTSVVEGYHSKFQKLIVVHHANIWKFLDEVREKHDLHKILEVVRRGHTKVKQPVNAKYERAQRRIHRLATSYEEYKDRNEVMLYLEAIYNIKIQPDDDE